MCKSALRGGAVLPLAIALAFALPIDRAVAADNGYDTAANSAYSGGWANGSNGGFGFGAWSHSTTSGNSSQNGHFAGTGHSAFGRSWGLYANSSQTASSVRTFNGGALSLNQTFSISMDTGFIDTGGTVGLSLQQGGTNRLEFYFVGGGTGYRYNNGSEVNTGVGFTTAGLRIFVTPTATNQARLRVTNATESSELFNQLITVTNATAIDRVRLFNANAGSGMDGVNDQFFDDLAIPEPGSAGVVLAGVALLSLRRRRLA
jgi:hypothetical protein